MENLIEYGILSHKYLIYAYLAVLLFHIFIVIKAKDIILYKRFIYIYNPILIIPTLGGVLFSGLVVFTAIGFSIDFANISMIIASIGIIIHEVKRVRELRGVTSDSFKSYKRLAFRYLGSNIVLVLIVVVIAVKFSS